MKLDYIETHLVDHCNLNCKGCSHFSTLSDKNFADFTTFQKDFQRLGELFEDISAIRLMGGEPLLHPDVSKFLEYTRGVFPNSDIFLVTNGTLLDRQQENFWETCHSKNILIQVTNYPISLDIKSIEKKAKKFRAKISFSELIIYFNKFVNASGDSDPSLAFSECQAMYRCPNLRDGKVYVCPFTPYVHIFNHFFGQQISVTSADYIDIHDNINASDILEFISYPIPMCRWCLHERTVFKWGVSQKKIEEWAGHNPKGLAFLFKKINTIMRKRFNVAGECVGAACAKLNRRMLSKSFGSITADPNPIRLSHDRSNITTILSWTSSGTEAVEVRVNAPDGALLSHSGPSGSAETGNWVRDGTIFYLQDVTGGLPLTHKNTLDRVRVRNIKNV